MEINIVIMFAKMCLIQLDLNVLHFSLETVLFYRIATKLLSNEK